MINRRALLGMGGAIAMSSVARDSFAETYPSHAISLIVPYAPGGNADLTARLFADALSRTMGHSVLVDNKGGGGGSIGALYVIGAKPDGHTLLFASTGVFSVTPHLVKTNYGVASIKPVGFVSKAPQLLLVRKGSKFKTLPDLVNAAKADPSGIAFGYGGIGSPNHLAMLNLESVAKIKMNGIAYKGSGPMLQDMLAGQVLVGADQISSSKPYIDSGDLVPLAVYGAELPILPGVQSMSTLGPEPFDVTTYLGVTAPLATPDHIISILRPAIKKALEDPRLIESLVKVGCSVYPGGDNEYEKTMRKENDYIKQMVALGKLQSE